MMDPVRFLENEDSLGLDPSVFDDLCQMSVEDGVVFLADSIKAAEIRKEANYAGIRVSMVALLGNARTAIQVDIGYGDAVTPAAPEEAGTPAPAAGTPMPEAGTPEPGTPAAPEDVKQVPVKVHHETLFDDAPDK
jgi:hypothetical protein